LRVFWSHGSFTVKESSCPEKCCSLERKAFEKLFYRLPACCPRSSHAKGRKKDAKGSHAVAQKNVVLWNEKLSKSFSTAYPRAVYARRTQKDAKRTQKVRTQKES